MDFRFSIYTNLPVGLPLGIPFIGTNKAIAQKDNPQFSGAQIEQEEPYYETSPLGTPWLFPFSTEPGSYPVRQPDGSIVQRLYPGYIFPPTSTAHFRRAKHVIETEVEGSEDTVVHEVVSLKDYEIRITGKIFSPQGEPGQINDMGYPFEEVQRLEALCNLPCPVEVIGRKFAMRGIHAMLIKDIEWPDVPGEVNYQPFTIVGVSDKPVIMNLNSKK